ncbi:MAG TPA: thioredoxin domain-containing protein [Terriglobales bacterium]|nr:thioredoxin domain-containing protein [Terriglobales bacterium]
MKCRLMFVCVLFSTLGCSAQSDKTEAETTALNRRIEQKVRTTFQLPISLKVTVGKRSPSEIPGYDVVPVTLSSASRTSTHQFLLSKDNTTLIEWEKLDISKDLMESIDTAGRPQRGNKDAKVTIVNYDDFQCPFCSRMHQTLFPDLMKTYGNQVKVIYKDYPLVEIHPWAMHAAVDANCLASQNNDAFWEFADYTHANQKAISGEKRDIDQEFSRLDQITRDLGSKYKLDSPRLDACIRKQDESTVRASLKEGDKLGVDATPTMFINGERVSGAASPEALREVIDRALKDAGQTPPSPSPTAAAATSQPAGQAGQPVTESARPR